MTRELRKLYTAIRRKEDDLLRCKNMYNIEQLQEELKKLRIRAQRLERA